MDDIVDEMMIEILNQMMQIGCKPINEIFWDKLSMNDKEMKESQKSFERKEITNYEMNDDELNEMTTFSWWFNRNDQEQWNSQ